MKRQDFLRLLEKYLSGHASAKEVRLLEEYYKRLDNSSAQDISGEQEDILYRTMLKNIFEKIHGAQPENRNYKIKRKKFIWYAAASIILILFIFTGAYIYKNRPPVQRIAAHQQPQDIVPGHNKALLTLSNGTTLILDSVHKGPLASQGNSKVIQISGGLLAYKLENQQHKPANKRQILFNTLATPRGGQYQLILPDGSKVWLNSASSIRYPTAFTGEERKVAITGEAYLEVAEDAAHPFVVTTRNTEITVLGTHFNVMAYANEPVVKTTLLEGSVKVSIPGSNKETIIKPGQQASVDSTDQYIAVKKVNAPDIAAWIHGLLSLRDYSVHEFMNQLSRWYDVNIEYVGDIPEERFGGMINRNALLSDVLAALDAIGIHTRLEGKKIIVLSH